ncbi:unnamed protein product [Absidia cylindrospora]
MANDLETDADLDKYFSQSEKHMEIERVMASFKLDPFGILELPYDNPSPKSIKMAYRGIRFNNATQLQFLLDLIQEAKVEILKGKGFEKIKMTTPGTTPTAVATTDGKSDTPAKQQQPTTSLSMVDDSVYPLLSTEQGQRDVQAKLKQLLIELELRRRRIIKRDLESEGAEARKVELAAKERKRKAEEQKEWENTRETRVNSWRDFQKKKKKVKKSA